MFDTCVLGVDPGVARCGLAAVVRRDRRTEVRWAGTVRTSTDMPEAERLHQLARAMREAIGRFEPASVAIERVAWNRNQVSALQVARATGVLMAVSAEAALEVEEYSPSEVKSAVTGAGNATKEQVAEALVRLHGLRGIPAEPDAADAVAVALTHLVGAPLKRAAARAGTR
jgi:crossover junction endodeoxyribonuclease RuvC